MADEASIPEISADRETAAALYEQAVCDALIAVLETQIARLHGELAEIRTKRRDPGRLSPGHLHGRPTDPAARPMNGANGRRTAA